MPQCVQSNEVSDPWEEGEGPAEQEEVEGGGAGVIEAGGGACCPGSVPAILSIPPMGPPT